MLKDEDFDGQIYFSIKDVPEEIEYEDEVLFEFDEAHPTYFYDEARSAGDRTLYERKLARWKDPLTLPKSRMKCAKTCRIGPIKTCCGWKTQFRWYYRTARIIVTTKVPKDIKGAVEDCLQQAIVAAAVAGLISGGSAAIAAAEAAFESCLIHKFAEDLLKVKITVKGNWGNWS